MAKDAGLIVKILFTSSLLLCPSLDSAPNCLGLKPGLGGRARRRGERT